MDTFIKFRKKNIINIKFRIMYLSQIIFHPNILTIIIIRIEDKMR